MKKTLVFVSLLAVLLLAVGAYGIVYAQERYPTPSETPNTPYGDMMSGSGYGDMMGGYGYGDMMSGSGYGGMTGEYGYGDMMGSSGYGGMTGEYGYGSMMGGYGYGGMMGMMMGGEEGPMHDDMVAALADALGLTPEEVEARHDAGETLWDIAAGQGLSPEEINDLMLSLHDEALDEAVDEGWLTSDQAEWMDAHMEDMMGGNYGGMMNYNGSTDSAYGGMMGGYAGPRSGSDW